MHCRRRAAAIRAPLGLALALALALLAGCATPVFDVPRPESHAIERPEDTFLGRAFAAQLAAAPGQSGFRLLVAGQEAFLARAALADAAQRSLDLQYYAVSDDATATLLLYRALQAAQRGVRVRLLVDDLWAAGRDADLAMLAAHPNVQVRVFNPFAHRGLRLWRLLDILGEGDRLNRRMHNKVWIADNAAAVFGGRNLGDAYFDARPETGFSDLDVLAVGPVVAQVSDSFDEYWNNEAAVPIAAFVGERPSARQVEAVMAEMAASADRFRETEYARALVTTPFASELRAGTLPLVAAPATVLYDAPAKASRGASGDAPGRIISALRPVVEGARREVFLVSPYFIPSERGLAVLCGLTRRGVRVRVLTNSLASTDVPAVHAGYAQYRPKLLACGVELHELRRSARGPGRLRPGFSSAASLHAKAVVVDRRSLLVGSMNLDPRSRLYNTELGVLIESPALGAQLGTLFDEATDSEQAFRLRLAPPEALTTLIWEGVQDGQPVQYDSEPLASWWRRFLAGVFSAFAPEEML